MQNLARDERASEIVKKELYRLGINRVETNPISEVPSIYTGELRGFTFERAWYYYIVKGKLPLESAKKLYQHPIGKEDIRVCGHCGCPPPEDPWVEYYDDNGTKVYSIKNKEEFEQFSNSEVESLAKRFKELLDTSIFAEDRSKYNAFVESYHVDSEAGMLLLVQEIENLS